MNVGVE